MALIVVRADLPSMATSWLHATDPQLERICFPLAHRVPNFPVRATNRHCAFQMLGAGWKPNKQSSAVGCAAPCDVHLDYIQAPRTFAPPREKRPGVGGEEFYGKECWQLRLRIICRHMHILLCIRGERLIAPTVFYSYLNLTLTLVTCGE